MIITDEIERLINAEGTIAAVATVGEGGVPHVVYKRVGAVDGDTLAVPEAVETSQSGKNMLRAIWESSRVAVNVLDPTSGASIQLKGSVTDYLFFGPVFDEMFARLDPLTGTGIAGVWLVKVDEVRDNSLAARVAEEVSHHLRVYWERIQNFAPYVG